VEKTPQNMYVVSMGRGEREFQDLREDSVGVRDWEFRRFWWGRRWSEELREGNRCAEAHQESCFVLVIVENSEGKVGFMFSLLSPKLDWTALSCAGRGMCLAKDKNFNLWHPADLVLGTTSRILLDVIPLPFKHKSICLSKISLWATDKSRQTEVWQALCEVSRPLVLCNSTPVLWHSCTELAATSLWPRWGQMITAS